MKKWILCSLALMVWNQSVFSVRYTCKDKCFHYCKFREQAVKNCEIFQVTSVSFRVQCECRPLKKGEILPLYFHHSRIINTSAR